MIAVWKRIVRAAVVALLEITPLEGHQFRHAKPAAVEEAKDDAVSLALLGVQHALHSVFGEDTLRQIIPDLLELHNLPTSSCESRQRNTYESPPKPLTAEERANLWRLEQARQLLRWWVIESQHGLYA